MSTLSQEEVRAEEREPFVMRQIREIQGRLEGLELTFLKRMMRIEGLVVDELRTIGHDLVQLTEELESEEKK